MTQSSLKRLEEAFEDKGLRFEKEQSPRLYIFYSFDLVNSTAYKTKQKEEWPFVFSVFYDALRKEMKQQFRTIEVWKYIGDEVLFFKVINSETELFEVIPGSFRVLTSIMKHLNNTFPGSLESLSLKGTIWCAPVVTPPGEELKDLDVKESKARNFALNFPHENHSTQKDFIGPDIDIGFRISKYSEKEKVVISADFAYLLLEANAPAGFKKNDLIKNLKIVSYEDLKGIWNDRYYPVIWYYEDWENIKETFAYDERFKSKIVNNVCLGQVEPLEEIRKIFDQLNLLDEKNDLLKILREGAFGAPEL